MRIKRFNENINLDLIDFDIIDGTGVNSDDEILDSDFGGMLFTIEDIKDAFREIERGINGKRFHSIDCQLYKEEFIEKLYYSKD